MIGSLAAARHRVSATGPLLFSPAYFVAPVANGGNDANSGTIGSPWATITHAQTVMQTGNKVTYFRAGTYTLGSPFAMSTADNGTTYAAYPGETATISGGGSNYINIPDFTTDVTFMGLTFTGLAPNGGPGWCFWIHGANRIRVLWCTFNNLASTVIGGGAVTNTIVDSCTFNNTTGTNNVAEWQNSTSNTMLSHNLINGCQGMGLGCSNGTGGWTNMIYDRNLLINTLSATPGDQGALYMHDISALATGAQITNNVVHGCGTGSGSGALPGTNYIYTDAYLRSVTISGNLCYSAGGHTPDRIMHINSTQNAKIFNNVFVCDPGMELGWWQNFNPAISMSGDTFQNNIVYHPTTCSNPQNHNEAPQTPVADSNNIYFSGNGSAIFNTGNGPVDSAPDNKDPQFVNAAAFNYALQVTSPAYADLGWHNLPTDQGPRPQPTFIRTNYVQNPRGEGFTAGQIGSGGVMPTAWAWDPGTDTNLHCTVSAANGANVENGVPYCEFRIQRVANTTQSAAKIKMELFSASPYVGTTCGGQIVQGSVVSSSVYLKLQAGSFQNVLSWFLDMEELGASNNYLADLFSPALQLPTLSVPLDTQLYKLENQTCSAVGVTQVTFYLYFLTDTQNLPIDFTVRVGAPNLEVSSNNWGFLNVPCPGGAKGQNQGTWV